MDPDGDHLQQECLELESLSLIAVRETPAHVENLGIHFHMSSDDHSSAVEGI